MSENRIKMEATITVGDHVKTVYSSGTFAPDFGMVELSDAIDLADETVEFYSVKWAHQLTEALRSLMRSIAVEESQGGA